MFWTENSKYKGPEVQISPSQSKDKEEAMSWSGAMEEGRAVGDKGSRADSIA
jgi:hypothetical protein